MGKVIYLTGAPATGKSTLCEAIVQAVPGVEYYAYSALLRDVVNQRRQEKIDERGIREKSAAVITKEDVDATDDRIISEISTKRLDRHIIIDSHPVTKEAYGFRITPFTLDKLKALNPDVIVCAYASAEAIVQRIKANPAGRPLSSEFEIELHIQLQASLAAQYSFLLDKACYLIDTDASQEIVKQRFLDIARIT